MWTVRTIGLRLCQTGDIDYVAINGLAATTRIADCLRDRRCISLEHHARQEGAPGSGRRLWMQFGQNWPAAERDISSAKGRAIADPNKKSINQRLAPRLISSY